MMDLSTEGLASLIRSGDCDAHTAVHHGRRRTVPKQGRRCACGTVLRETNTDKHGECAPCAARRNRAWLRGEAARAISEAQDERRKQRSVPWALRRDVAREPKPSDVPGLAWLLAQPPLRWQDLQVAARTWCGDGYAPIRWRAWGWLDFEASGRGGSRKRWKLSVSGRAAIRKAQIATGEAAALARQEVA